MAPIELSSEPENPFDYMPDGKTSGRINNIPYATCGICGYTMYQPAPTGIWIHADMPDDFTEKEDHIPRFATTLELLVIENHKEDAKASNSYDRKHCACYLHQKYWLQILGLDLDDNELENNIPKKIEKHDEPDWPEIDGKNDFGAYWWVNHERMNYLAFAKYIVSRKIKYLKKNLPNKAKVKVNIYSKKRKNDSTIFYITKDRIYEWDNVLQKGDEIKIKGEIYVIVDEVSEPTMSDVDIAHTSYHVQLKKIAKSWSK